MNSRLLYCTECDGKYRCPDAMFDIKNPFMMDTQFKKEIQNQVENKIDDTTNSVIKNKQVFPNKCSSIILKDMNIIHHNI